MRHVVAEASACLRSGADNSCPSTTSRAICRRDNSVGRHPSTTGRQRRAPPVPGRGHSLPARGKNGLAVWEKTAGTPNSGDECLSTGSVGWLRPRSSIGPGLYVLLPSAVYRQWLVGWLEFSVSFQHKYDYIRVDYGQMAYVDVPLYS